MVYRIFVEKRQGLENEAKATFAELTGLLGIKGLTGVRLLNRYDVEGLAEDLFREAVSTVFADSENVGDFAVDHPIAVLIDFDRRCI